MLKACTTVAVLLLAHSLAAQTKISEIRGGFDLSTGLVLNEKDDLAFATDPGSDLVLKFRCSTGEILSTLRIPGAGLGAAALSPDGRTLVVLGINTQRVYIIDSATPLTVKKDRGYQVNDEKSGFTGANNLIFISPDNFNVLIPDGTRNVVAVVNLLQDSLDHFIPLPNGINPTSLVPIPNSSRVAVLCSGAQPGDEERVYILDGLGVRDFFSLTAGGFNLAPFNNIRTMPGKILISSYNDDQIAVYDTKTFALDHRSSIGKGPGKIVISPDNRFAAVVNAVSKNVVVFPLPITFNDYAIVDAPGLDVSSQTTPAFSPDGETLYIPSISGNEIVVYDVNQKSVSKRIPTGKGPTQLSLSSPAGAVLTSIDVGAKLISLITMNAIPFHLPHLIQDVGNYSGLALANFGEKGVAVALTARNNAGVPVKGGSNPRFLNIPPNQQVSLVAADIFGFDRNDSIDGYIEAYASDPAVTLLYLSGTIRQTALEGFIAESSSGRLIGFSRITEGISKFGVPTSTEIILENLSDNDASLKLTLYATTPGGPGTIIRSQDISLAAHKRIHAPISELLPSAFYPLENAYLEVDSLSNAAIKGLEVVTIGNGVAMIPATVRGTPDTSFFAAQFVSGGTGPTYYSNLSLINTKDTPITVTAQVTGDDGKLIPRGSKPVVRVLQPFEAVSGGANDLFGFPNPLSDPTVYVGTLQITADKPGLIADLLYGDARDGRFITGQNLHAQKGKRFGLGHMTQGVFGNPPKEIYTGIAIYNPNLNTASLTIEAFAPDGTRVGISPLQLGAGQRISQLLSQLIPELKRVEPLGGGSITITSDLPILLFEVFGSGSDFLVAVPPLLLAP